MIAWLKGVVLFKDRSSLVLDVNGVGYLVQVTTGTLRGAQPGEEVSLHVHTQVREDAIQLFGFSDPLERTVFETLLAVNKVGTRVAMAVLSTLRPWDLSRAVETADLPTLQRVPGVGKRLAQRLSLELAGKLDVEPPPGEAAQAGQVPPKTDQRLSLALAQLGFRRSEMEPVLERVSREPGPDATLEERLRAALKLLSAGASR